MKRTGILCAPLLLLMFSFMRMSFYAPADIDHAAVLRSLNSNTLEKGKQIYTRSCIACHGANGTATNPQARSFSKDKLRFGSKPYAMWLTVSNGAAQMAPQTWLSPAERYYVIQYIRETFIRKANPSQYFKITDQYLATLPKSKKTLEEQLAITKKEALNGSQQYGQEWFGNHSSDYGTAVYSQLKDHATAALTVTLDNDIKLSYNLLRMGTTAVWKGSLNLSETKYKKYRGEGQPAVQGKALDGIDLWQWSFHDLLDSLQLATGVRTPLPPEFLDYHGNYVYKKKVILSYAISGRNVLELPEASAWKGIPVLLQTLTISPGPSSQEIYIGQLTHGVGITNANSTTLMDPKTKKFLSVGIISPNKNISCRIDLRNRMVLQIPAADKSFTVQVLRASGTGQKLLSFFEDYVITKRRTGLADLENMIKGGPPQRQIIVKTTGQSNVNRPHFDPAFSKDKDRTSPQKAVPLPADFPYTIDNIALPFNNPYNAWIRPTCLGFKKNGSLVMGTYLGDVWLATGIDSTLKNISWQRIATGLFECMGLKVVDDQIYVTTRNGIVLLHDLNGDGETDFYENFHPDQDMSSFFHSFNFGLETDSRGNFYYTKVGEYTDNKDPGNVIRVSRDGKKAESIATGFRVNNGITIAPDDRIFVSDNQGNWEPANKICLIKKGAYYGYVPNLVSPNEWSPNGRQFSKKDLLDNVISPDLVKVPDSFEAPVIWMPQEFDNSPGGGVWSDKHWGPLGDQFIHTSYGTGWVYYFLIHEVEGVTQGALVSFPFQLDAGIQRASVNPVDKQVYVTGLTGWDDPEAIKYGVLNRVRYTGGNGHLIKDAEVTPNGIKLSFNFKLDSADFRNTVHVEISEWNYAWTSKYGSAHYSVKTSGIEGEDSLEVKDMMLGDDRKSLILSIPDISPAQTVRLRFDVTGEDGTRVKNAVYLTINKVPR